MGIYKQNFSRVLFSGTQQKVLGLLYGQCENDLHTNEIIRRVQAGTGAVQRELVKLTASGLVAVKAVGNQKRYQANHETPFFAELKGLILKTFGLSDTLKQALAAHAEKIDFAFIYGSIAKQQETTNSDIDLMIISNTVTYSDVFPLLNEAEAALGRKINPTFYSLAEWDQKRCAGNYFITQLIKQPKIFLIGTENAF